MKQAYLNWSSGKDAALALYHIQKKKEFEIKTLVTTINSEVERISMHGVRKELLLQQAKSLQLPLHIISLKGNVSMASYNDIMKTETLKLKSLGLDYSIFGDIFLEDLKEYRENQLKVVGISAVFPLWKQNTQEIIKEFIDLGFKAITVCVNSKLLEKSFCGRIIDNQFIKDLPATVDPCGENGEFHTFVFDGPIFPEAVKFEVGEVVEKFYYSDKDNKKNCFKKKKERWDTAFWFCDLIPS